jgi:hypothetical protein
VANALDFNPVKIPTNEFPFPVGSTVQGHFFALYTVVDRDGFAFLACCADHEDDGTASGWYPVTENGRMLATLDASDLPLGPNCGG